MWPSNPLVAHVHGLDCARLPMRGGGAEVKIGTRRYQTERFTSFVDGLSGACPRRGA
jgi:hypothetical protein